MLIFQMMTENDNELLGSACDWQLSITEEGIHNSEKSLSYGEPENLLSDNTEMHNSCAKENQSLSRYSFLQRSGNEESKSNVSSFIK